MLLIDHEYGIFNCMGLAIDITGKKFGKLTAIKFDHSIHYTSKKEKRQRWIRVWLFKCDCGNQTLKRVADVTNGMTKSCGCVVRKHGMKGTKFYAVWGLMKCRCYNSNHKSWKDYGGRGIKMETRWLTFLNFYNDMYKSYFKHVKQYGQKKTQIDRIYNSKGYSKENCRWVTPSENTRNKRNNHLLTFNGRTLPVVSWAEITGINANTIYKRIENGFSVERTLSKKLFPKMTY